MIPEKAKLTTLTLLVVVGLAIAPFAFGGLAVDSAAAQSNEFSSEVTGVVNPDGSAIAVEPSHPADYFEIEASDSGGSLFNTEFDATSQGAVTVNGSAPNIELDIEALSDGENARFEVNGVVAEIQSLDGEAQPDGTTEANLNGEYQTIQLDVDDEALAGEPLPELSGLDIAEQGTDVSVVSGTAGNISVNVTNTGDSETRSYDLNFTIANETDTVVETTKTTSDLAPGDSETVTLADPISGLDNDDYTVSVADSNGADEVTGTLAVEEATAAVDFQDQATLGNTITSENRTTPAVVAENVSANVDSTLVVTYENGTDTTIASLKSFTATELDGSDKTIPLYSGGPGAHTIHVIPTAELSAEYAPGDVVSDDTEAAALATADATVFVAFVDFPNQTATDAAEGDDLFVYSIVDDGDGEDSDTKYVVNLHEADENGTPGDFVGSTAVRTGGVGDRLTLQTPDGENVSINETGEYVAMLHLVDDDAAVNESTLPGQYPVLPNADADEGFVPGGVTDSGTVSVVSLTFNDQATASSTIASENVTDPGVVVEDVATETDSAVIISYPNENGDLVVAGIEQFAADELNGDDVVIGVKNTTQFPGFHLGHLIPQSDLSSDYAPGDTISNETDLNISVYKDAVVYQGTVEFDEQEYVNNTSTVDVSTTNLDQPFTDYVVVVHETTEDGSVGAVVGSSGNLSGEQTDVEISLNEQINETDEYVAMLHFPSSTGPFGAAIPNADANTGFVAGNVADSDTVTILTPAESDLTNLDVDSQGANGTIVEGDNETVAVDVTNRGDEVSDFEVTLEIEGQDAVNETSTTLGLNETDMVAFENATGDLAAGEYNVTVRTADDELTGTLTVQTPADPALADLDIAEQGNSAEIVAGDAEPVAVNVTNLGEEPSTFDVTLDIEGAANVTQTSAELSDETDTVTFADATSGLDAGTYNVSVTTGDEEVTGNVTVLTAVESEVSNLDIAGEGDDAEIVAGDDETVTADVTNNGSETGAVTVDLLVDGTVADRVRVTDLASNDTETVTFDSATGDLAAGDYEVAVQTADDSVAGNLSVITPADPELSAFDIAGQGDTAELLTSNNESVTVDVTNLGEEKSTFDVTLDIDGETDTKTTDTLGLDDTETVTFENATGTLTAGTYNVTVSTADEELNGSVTVYTPVEDGQSEVSELDIAGQNDSATIVEGDDETISADVTNNGTADGAVAVELATDNGETVLDEQIVEVAGGETTSVAFANATGDLTAGDYDVTVQTADDSVSGTLTVQTPAKPTLTGLDIAGQDDAATIVEADDESVTVDVANLGEETSAFDVTLDIEGQEPEQTTTETLGLGETDTITFEGVTGDLDAGEYDVDVTTGGASTSGTLTVQTPAEPDLTNLDIAGQDDAATIVEADDESVTVDVTNLGEETSAFDVTLDIEGQEPEQTTTDTLSLDETDTITFEGVTGGLDAGEYDVDVTTDGVSTSSTLGASTSGTLTVQTPAASELSTLDIAGQGTDAEIDEGDDESVTVDVENVGEADGTFDVTLTREGSNLTLTEPVTLAGSDSETVTFENVTGDFAPGDYNVTISTDDGDTIAGTLSIAAEPAPSSGGGGGGGGGGGSSGGGSGTSTTVDTSDFEITSLEPGDVTVEQGETVDVTVTVENVGGLKGSTPLELRLDGVVVAEGEVPTTTRESVETVTFSGLETAELEPGDYTYGAYIDGTEQTATLSVDAVDDGDTSGDTDDGSDGDSTDGDGGTGDSTDDDDGTGDSTDDDGGTGDSTDDGGSDGDNTDDSTPGFGAVVTLLALLLAAGFLTRRR